MEESKPKDYDAVLDDLLQRGISVVGFETDPSRSIFINRQWLIEIVLLYLEEHKVLPIDRKQLEIFSTF